MEKEDGSVEQKGAVGGQQKPSTPTTTGGTQPKKTPIKGPKPPIPPRRSSTLDSQSSPDTEKSCEVSDNNDKKIRENERTTTTITSPKENNKKSRETDNKSSAVSRKKIDDTAIKGAETGNGNNIKVGKVELTENLDNKQKVGEDEGVPAAAIEIKKEDQGHVTSSNTKIEKIRETKTTKSNNTVDEDITSNVLLSMLTSTEEKNKIIEKKSDDVVNISSCEEKEILEKKTDKKIRETDTKSDKDIIKSAATSQKIEISEKAAGKNMTKKEIFNNSGTTVKVEIEENVAIIEEEEKVELVIKKDEKIKSEKMEIDNKLKKCSTNEEATTSKEISSEVQQQEIQIRKSLVKKETLIYDETKDILITAKNKKKDEKSSDDEKTVKKIEDSTTTEINSKITTNKKISPNLEEPKVEKSDVIANKESDPNTTSGGGNRKPEMPPTGNKQTAQTSTRVEEDNKENKIKNQNDDGISSGSGLVANKKIDQVTTIPTAVSSTTTKSTPEILSRKNETTSKNVTKVAKMVINDDDKSVTLTNTKVEEKIAETKSVTKIDKSVTNDTSKTSKVDSSVTNTKSTTKNNDKSVTNIYRSTVTNAGKSVTNAAKSVTNAAKSATNIEKSVTNVKQSVTNFKYSKVTSPPGGVPAEPKPEMNQLKTGSTKQTAENSSNQDIINKSCEVNNTSNGLSVSTILDPEQEADRIFAQFKQRKRLFKRNLIIEGSCNYFFWMDKIAMVSSLSLSRKQFTSHGLLIFSTPIGNVFTD